MKILRSKTFRLLAGLMVFAFFAGDLVADAVADAESGCCAASGQSHQGESDKGCPQCSCTVHNGCAIAPEASVFRALAPTEEISLWTIERHAPAGARPAIDHPPQLA